MNWAFKSSSILLFSFLVFSILGGICNAQLLVTPQLTTINTFKGSLSTFNLQLFNNFSYPLYNVSFGNVTNFYFPSIPMLDVGEVRNVSVGVLTDSVYSSTVLSQVDFFYYYAYQSNASIVNSSINASGSSPSVFNLLTNDSISWINLLNYSISLVPFNSSFVQVDVPANSQVISSYNSVGSFPFWCSGCGGLVGLVNVSLRSNQSLFHDSSTTPQLVFTVTSILNPSSLRLTVLNSNLSTNVNQTVTGILEVRNLDNIPIVNISLSADRWVSSFSVNNFDLVAGANQLVFFNLTPIVSHNNDTNMTQFVTLYGRANNIAQVNSSFPIFLYFANLDSLIINGTCYNMLYLNVSGTIDACTQHMYDTGYESCLLLRQFGVNNTFYIHDNATCSIPEDRLKSWMNFQDAYPEERQRDRNQLNLYAERQDNVTTRMGATEEAIISNNNVTASDRANYAKSINGWKVTYWISIGLILSILIGVSVIVWVCNIRLIEARIKAGQS